MCVCLVCVELGCTGTKVCYRPDWVTRSGFTDKSVIPQLISQIYIQDSRDVNTSDLKIHRYIIGKYIDMPLHLS